MRVIKQEGESDIGLVLTKQEATYLWHALNRGWGNKGECDEYDLEKTNAAHPLPMNLTLEAVQEMFYKMWEDLSNGWGITGI
jgi:hypothetical protein